MSSELLHEPVTTGVLTDRAGEADRDLTGSGATTDAELAPHLEDTDLDAEELLVEEISIDGMCGVY
jgi:mycofactocin precursor